jgi:hypothetical protein
VNYAALAQYFGTIVITVALYTLSPIVGAIFAGIALVAFGALAERG